MGTTTPATTNRQYCTRILYHRNQHRKQGRLKMTNLYNYRGPHDARSQQRNLDALYSMLGLKQPTTYKDTRDLILAAPSADDVALRLAYAAYETDNPKKLVADAVKELQAAQAAEALKDAFLRAERTAANTTIRALV